MSESRTLLCAQHTCTCTEPEEAWNCCHSYLASPSPTAGEGGAGAEKLLKTACEAWATRIKDRPFASYEDRHAALDRIVKMTLAALTSTPTQEERGVALPDDPPQEFREGLGHIVQNHGGTLREIADELWTEAMGALRAALTTQEDRAGTGGAQIGVDGQNSEQAQQVELVLAALPHPPTSTGGKYAAQD